MSLNSIDKNNCINQQIFDIIHPSKFMDNFRTLDNFKEYLDQYRSSTALLIIPTLRKSLSVYEEWEGYEQCMILKDIIEIIVEERKNKKNI